MNNANVSEEEECFITEEQHQRYLEMLSQLYKKCDFTYNPKSDLSILSMKDRILSMIEANPIVIIQGPTGCGKTTQIPQLLLDANIKKRLHCNIIGIFSWINFAHIGSTVSI